jgi:hypothetical protein
MCDCLDIGDGDVETVVTVMTMISDARRNDILFTKQRQRKAIQNCRPIMKYTPASENDSWPNPSTVNPVDPPTPRKLKNSSINLIRKEFGGANVKISPTTPTFKFIWSTGMLFRVMVPSKA